MGIRLDSKCSNNYTDKIIVGKKVEPNLLALMVSKQGKPINFLILNIYGRNSARKINEFVGIGKWKKRRLQCNVEDRNIYFTRKRADFH
jgi:hypothetical protein